MFGAKQTFFDRNKIADYKRENKYFAKRCSDKMFYTPLTLQST